MPRPRMSAKETPNHTRKVTIWRVKHRYFTRVDADVYDGDGDRPQRLIDLDEARAVELVRGLFGGEKT